MKNMDWTVEGFKRSEGMKLECFFRPRLAMNTVYIRYRHLVNQKTLTDETRSKRN